MTTYDLIREYFTSGAWSFSTMLAAAFAFPPRGTPCPAITKEPLVTTLYAYPGVGKTPSLSCLPNLLHVDLQLGTKYCSFPPTSRRVIVSNYDEYILAAEEWRRDPTTFVAIDPITVLYDWSIQHATDAYRKKPVGKNFGDDGAETVLDLLGKNAQGQAFNTGYRFVRESFMKLARMFYPGPNSRTIFVGHVRDAIMADVGQGEKGGKTTSEFDGKDLDIDGKLRNIFLSECDLGIYMYRNALGELKLTTSTKKNNAFIKCRCPHLLAKTFTMHTPTTVDDWRQLFPDSIEKLAGKGEAPVPQTET